MKLAQQKRISFTRKELKDILLQHVKDHPGLGKFIPNNPNLRLDVFGNQSQMVDEVVVCIGFDEDSDYKS